MNKRFGAITAGIAGLAVVLSGCSGGTGSSSSAGGAASSGSGSSAATGSVKSIKLVAAEYSKDNTAKFWKAFAEKYKAKYGITLDVQVVSWDDIDQTSSTMVQNNSAPDILNLNVYASYAKDNLLYNSDEVLSSSVKSDLLTSFVNSGTYKDKLYGMPDLSSVRALFYNKDLFAKAGIAAPPKTWTEFEADTQKITALGNGTVGYALPLGPEEAHAEFSIWTFNNGGAWKKDGKWVINSAKNVETLNFLKKIAVTDKVTENNPGRENRTDGTFPIFTSGKAGMIVGFSPLSKTLDAAKKVNYGIAPMPTNDGQAARTFGVTDYLMAFKKTGNQQAVKDFYDLYYQPDQVNTFIKAEGFLPVTKSGVDVFTADKSLAVYLQTLPNAMLTPTDDPNWDKVKLAVAQNLGAAVAPNGDPQKVLDSLQKTAEAGG